MDFKTYQTEQLNGEQSRRTRNTVVVCFLMIVMLPASIIAETVVWTNYDRVTKSENAALDTLQRIRWAQTQLYGRRGRYGDFDQLRQDGLNFSDGYASHENYRFSISVTNTGSNWEYSVNADPISPAGVFSVIGYRYFYFHSTEPVIRFNYSTRAGRADPVEKR